jgi:mannosyl-3-phosphoglycerate phosphatase
MPDRSRRLAVVTDLDGCLLDAVTYDHTPAAPLLRRLRRTGVPVAFCTSKTRAEVAALYRALGGAHVAIVEDGGGILVPPGLVRGPLPSARRTVHGRLVPLGPPVAQVRAMIRRLPAAVRAAVRGFGEMTPAQLMGATGLEATDARRAAHREFDEPLLVRGTRALAALRRAAARHGLVVTRGGRFFHLHGQYHKGTAIGRLRALLEREHGPLRLVAIGDSPLDTPMLRAADVAVIIPRVDGRPDPDLRRLVPRATVAPAAGPRGWARAVTHLLDGA